MCIREQRTPGSYCSVVNRFITPTQRVSLNLLKQIKTVLAGIPEIKKSKESWRLSGGFGSVHALDPVKCLEIELMKWQQYQRHHIAWLIPHQHHYRKPTKRGAGKTMVFQLTCTDMIQCIAFLQHTGNIVRLGNSVGSHTFCNYDLFCVKKIN